MDEGTRGVTEVDRLRIWVLTDNTYDALRPDTAIATRYRAAPGKSIHAEHGLAYFIETTVGGKTSACMFDYGLDPAGVLGNAALLGVDLGTADAFALSHGHFDHFTGALRVLEEARARLAPGTRFYVGEEAFARRLSVRPGGAEVQDLGRLSREAIEARGLKVVEVRESSELIPGVYLTGNITRVTDYERPPPSLLVQRGATPEPDDFRGEQALCVRVKGKGLVVVSGCAHAGIVNTVRHAMGVSGGGKVHAVLGGFHLTNAPAEVVERTVEDLRALGPDYVIPAHCTGFEALVALGKAMPRAFHLNTAGTRYTFGADR